MEDISGRDKLHEENPEEGRHSVGVRLKSSETQFQNRGVTMPPNNSWTPAGYATVHLNSDGIYPERGPDATS